MHPELDFGSLLELLLPTIDEGLCPSGSQRQQLLAVAAQLPAASQALLEFRTARAGQPVDFSQHFARDDRASLLAFLASPKETDENWNTIQRLARTWQEQENTLPGFTDLWLEYDCGPSQPPPMACPAVFLKLDKEPQAFDAARPRFSSLLNMLAGEDQGDACLQTLQQLVLSLEKPAAPAYLGAMLSRPQQGIRAHFQFQNGVAAVDWLEKNDWPGPITTLEDCLDLLAPLQSHCMICLELLPHLSPRLGIEIYRDGEPGREAELLDLLLAQGWCSPGAAAAIAAWPGSTTPANAERAWPEQWIAQSLERAEDSLDLVERRINHFKLVCDRDRPIEAKVYLAFTHRWLGPQRHPAAGSDVRA